jgi:hypothetical protein
MLTEILNNVFTKTQRLALDVGVQPAFFGHVQRVKLLANSFPSRGVLRMVGP